MEVDTWSLVATQLVFVCCTCSFLNLCSLHTSMSYSPQHRAWVRKQGSHGRQEEQMGCSRCPMTPAFAAGGRLAYLGAWVPLSLSLSKLFAEEQAERPGRLLYQDGFCTILYLLLGSPRPAAQALHAELCHAGPHPGLSFSEFPAAPPPPKGCWASREQALPQRGWGRRSGPEGKREDLSWRVQSWLRGPPSSHSSFFLPSDLSRSVPGLLPPRPAPREAL